MVRSSLSLALTLAVGLAVAGGAGQTGQTNPKVKTVVAQSLEEKPGSRVEGQETVNDVVAAAVIGAIAGQFEGRPVEAKLDAVEVGAVSVRDRTVSGHGRLEFDGDGEWIPFQFKTLYDTEKTTAAFPQLVIGGDLSEKIAPDSMLARQLRERVDAGVEAEFAQQSARITLDPISIAKPTGRYQRVNGAGSVDFGAEGSTPVRVNALFDRRNGTFLRVVYELGPGGLWGDPATLAGP